MDQAGVNRIGERAAFRCFSRRQALIQAAADLAAVGFAHTAAQEATPGDEGDPTGDDVLSAFGRAGHGLTMRE